MAKLTFHKASGQYVVYLNYFGKRKTHYLGHDEDAAKKRYHEILLRYVSDKKSLVQQQATLFAQLAEQFLLAKKSYISPTTLKEYTTRLNVIFSLFPKLKIKDIDLNFLDKLREYLRTSRIQPIRNTRGVSANSRNRYVKVIKMVINFGLERAMITPDEVVLHKIKYEPVKRTPPRFLSTEEIKKILEYRPPSSTSVTNRRSFETTRNIICFMLATGRRVQEVAALKKCDISGLEVGKYYEVKNDKTARTNPVPKIYYLNQMAVDALRPYYEKRKPYQHIFLNEKGKPLTPTAIGQRFKRICKAVGIPDVVTKELRHSFASHLLMQGEAIENIKEHLGHTDVRTTQVYAHLSECHLKTSINKVDYGFSQGA